MATLSDDAFRTVIKGKALANISGTTIPDINRLLLLLFPGQDCWVANGATPLTVVYNLTGFSDLQKALVQYTDILPVPAGASVTFNFL